MENQIIRNNQWLTERLQHIWQNHFADIPKVNEVTISFGRAGRRQLGSIKAKGPRRRFRRPGRFPKVSWWLPESVSIITINGHFQNPTIPLELIDTTIAHELIHYAHGFCSPHPQLFRYPHHGRVVHKELVDRGLADSLKFQKKWLKENWKSTYQMEIL